MKRSWNLGVWASLLLVVCLSMGCVSGASVTVLKSYPRRPGDYPVYLTDGDVAEPHEDVATIKTPAYEDYESRERGEHCLRYWARRVGGDAVIWVKREPAVEEKLAYRPTGTFRTGTTLVTKYRYTGVVVRFDRALIEERKSGLGP